MLTFEEINALGRAVDSSFGTSSTPQTTSYSVKMSLIGDDKLKVNYMAIVSFASQREYSLLKKKYEEEADVVIAAVLKNVKAKYKELLDKTLKLKEDSSIDDIEIVNLGVHNPKRTAYYRSTAIYSIS
jgi:hypothetical protein